MEHTMRRTAGVVLALASMIAFDLRAAEVNKAGALSQGANAGLAASAGVGIKTSSEAGQSLAFDPSASYAGQWADGAFEISTDASLDYLLDEGRLGDSTANLISSYQSQIGTDL